MTAKEKLIKGKKGGASSSTSAKTDPNDLLSTAYTKIVMAICNGEIDDLTGQDIFLGGTPLLADDGTENFSGVTWDYRKGTQDQSYMQGIPGTENETSVQVDVTTSTPWTHFFSDTQLSAVRITLDLYACYEQNTSSGDVTGSTAGYKIEVSTDGGAYAEANVGTFTGKCTSDYLRSIRVDLPAANTGWTVRVSRTTPDSTSDYIVNKFGVYSYTSIVDAKFRYPLTAVIMISYDAKNFSNTPALTVRARRYIRVPDNYDPETRTYTGTWTGSFKFALSDNPAWCFYDWLVNDIYGLGDIIQAANISLTKYDLYEVAQYCDQLVPDGNGGTGTEPRHRCNAFIQSQEDAYTVLNDFASIFNGAAFWYADQVNITYDHPDDYGFGFNNANVINGTFTYAGGSVKNRYSQAVVQYSDPSNHYDDATKVASVLDYQKRYGVRQGTYSAVGCTRESEANRKGLYYIYTNNLDAQVTFSTGLEGFIPYPGMIMPIADYSRAAAPIGGRIESSGSNRTFTLDRVPRAVAGDKFLINLPDGTAGQGVIQSISGKVITLSAALTQVPVDNASWLIDSDDLAVQTYKCVTVTDNNDGTFDITGIIYNESKFDAIDTGARLDVKPFTVTPSSTMQVPKNILITEYAFVEQTMAVSNMRVTWDPVDGAIQYTAQWRKDNGDWVNASPNSSSSFEVPAIYTGNYQVRVSATNQGNVSSAWGYSDITALTGKSGSPDAPLNFAATSDQVFAIQYTWTMPTSAGDANYTEIQYAANSDKSDATLLADVAAPTSKYIQAGLKSGQKFYARARIVDKSGNQSPWTDWVTGTSSYDAEVIIDQIDASIRDSDAWKELTQEIDLKANQTDLDTAITNATNAINQARIDANAYSDAANSSLSTSLTSQINQSVQTAKDYTDSAVSDLKDQIGDIETDVQGAKDYTDSKVTELNSAISSAQTNAQNYADQAVAQEVVDRNAAVKDVQTQVTNLTTNVNDYASSVNQKLDTISTEQASQASSITKLQSSLSGKADASALATLQTTVTQQGNTITSQGNSITSLQNSLSGKADASTVSALSSKVTEQGNTITSQGNSITSLQNSVSSINSTLSTKADASALATLNNTVTSQGNTITSQGSQITSLQNSVTSINNTLATKADASALTSLSNTVTQQGNTLTAQAQQITSLSASIDDNTAKLNTMSSALLTNSMAIAEAVTNQQVGFANAQAKYDSVVTTIAKQDYAQTKRTETLAAQVDNNLSNLTNYQETVADQFSSQAKSINDLQSALDDAEAGISTNASAISSLQTKTDTLNGDTQSNSIQINALKNSIDQINDDLETKADSSALSSLQSTVTQQGKTITSQGDSITSLQNSVSSINSTLSTKADASAVSALNSTVTSQGNTITSQGQAITNLQNSVTSINNTLSTKADSSALTTLSNTVKSQGDTITSQGNSITSLQNSVSSINSTLSTKADASTVSSLTNTVNQQGDTITSQGKSITSLQNSVSTINDTLSTKADSSTVSSLTNTVNQQGSTITSQGNSITSLQNSVSSINSTLSTKADTSALNALSNTVTSQGNTISTQGQAITSLQSSVTTINNTLATKADASALTSLSNTVTQQGNTLTAQAQQLTSLTASVDANTGQINNLAYTALTNALSSAEAVTNQLVTFGNAQASYDLLVKTVANNDNAMAEKVERLSASVNDNVSTILTSQQVISDSVSSQATQINQISSSVDQNTAAIQVKATTQFSSGSATASYAVNAGITYNGAYYDAGMVISLSGGKSSILFNADTFAVYNGTSDNSALPFVVTGSQVYLRDAFIADGTITTAKIADTISSANYVSGQTGWAINKSGTIEINGYVSGQGRMVISNNRITIYDENNSVAVVLGQKL